jgi:hypothetical protein
MSKESVLYPSLFLYYINDIPVGLSFTMRLFQTTTLHTWLYNPLLMYNICNTILTNLQYEKGNGKWFFIQTNVTSCLSPETNIRSNLHCIPSIVIIRVIRRNQLCWSNNQTRFKMEKIKSTRRPI